MPFASSPACSFVGIDVAKDSLAAAVTGRAPRMFPNTQAGTAALLAWARSASPDGELRCVCESSGPYSAFMAHNLLAHGGVSVAIVNPLRVRHYARALGRYSKTDRLDAQVILDYALHAQPEPYTPPAPELARLSALCRELEFLDGERRRLRNRQHSQGYLPLTPDEVHGAQQRLLEAVDLELKRVRAAIKALLSAAPALQSQRGLLLTIPWIGPVASLGLLCIVAVLRQYNARELAQYAGLAPAHKESGTSVRGKSAITHMGHARVRYLMYMAAISAAHHNPQLSEDYQRLLAAGKPKKLALTAIARKLLLLAQAIIRSGKPFDPNYGGAAS